MAATGVFIDVDDSSIYKPYIESLWWNKVSVGTSGTQPYVDLVFSPSSDIPNQQLLTFIVRALVANLEPTLEKDGRAPDLYSDMPASSVYHPYVQKATKMGVNCGPDRETAPIDYGPGLIRAANCTTRAQMATFVVRARRWTLFDPASATFYLDVPTTHKYYKYVETLHKYGVTAGTGPGLFSPDICIPREQMAVFIVKGFELQLDPRPGAPTGSG